HDLDVEAAETAASLGLPFARAKAPGPDPRFAAMVAELVAERVAGAAPRALGRFGPATYGTGNLAGRAGSCPADCCRYVPARPHGGRTPAARPAPARVHGPRWSPSPGGRDERHGQHQRRGPA